MKFRLVDRILDWEPRRVIRGVKAVSFEEYELKRAWGDEPCLPESLVLESLLQLGNWLVIRSSDSLPSAVALPYIMRIALMPNNY